MSDSDDDIPISELIKKRKLQQQAAVKAEAKNKPEVKKVKTEKAEKPSKSERSSDSKSNNPLARVTNFNKAAEFYTETQKGLMVQKFLIRWWYAMEWPLPDEIGVPPPGYESLDGFRGVFISTKVGYPALLKLLVQSFSFRLIVWVRLLTCAITTMLPRFKTYLK